MKKLLLIFLLLPLLLNAQISNKKKAFIMSQSGGGTPSTNITSVTFAIDTIQYTNAPIVLVATPNVSVLKSGWRIYDESGVMQGYAEGNSVSISTVTNPGYYTIIYEGLTATDRIYKSWDDMLVLLPRFTEAQADLVINMASGNYYNDFASADHTGMKIYLKGTGTGYFAALNLRGTAGWANHVRVQVDDASGFNQTGVSGADAITFTGGRYITIDGYKSDKTKGWKLTNPTGGYFEFRIENTVGFTEIVLAGLQSIRTGATNDRASISWVPPVNATYNATNWVAENMAIYNCYIKGSGAEGIYIFYTNDNPQSGYTPPKARNVRVVWNKVLNSGNDAIQNSSCINALVHDNYIDTWGIQQSSGHEAAFSWNEGNSGRLYNNYAINGKMFISAKSGLYPYDIQAGGTTPLALYVYNNVGIQGTELGGTPEPVFTYIQSNNTASTNTWPVHWFNNTMIADKLGITFAFNSSGGYRIPNLSLFNNVFVKTGGTYEYAYSGSGTYPSSPVINNVVRSFSSYSDLLLTNGKPTSLSSPVFTSPTATSTYITAFTLNDKDGYPLLANSYVHGAYNLYNTQVISPALVDGSAATITTPVAVGSLTESGGVISYEANKQGLLYWVVVADGATAPTIAQVKTGGYYASGNILDGGTAQTGTISGLPTPGTAYDLYYVFTTTSYVDQASVTKVDFTTISDVVAPTLSGWEIRNANPNRLYFNSSEVITASTVTGFTITGILGTAVTVSSVTINTGLTTDHYFTLSENVEAIDYLAKIAYTSGSNFVDGASNALASFSATAITNSVTYSKKININISNSANYVSLSSWNDVDLASSVGIKTLIANVKDDTNTSTGFVFAISDAFHTANNAVNATAGTYISNTNAIVRGIEVYNGGDASGTLRFSGLTSGKAFDIIYLIKNTFGTGAGNVNINGAGSVGYTTGTVERKASGTVNGSGYIDIVMSQTTSNTSECMVALILIIYP